MKITKLFAVVALMASPALAETQHDTAPKADTAKPAAPKQGSPKNDKTPKAPPAPGMAAPRVLPNGRPACGNTVGKGQRPKDCVSEAPKGGTT